MKIITIRQPFASALLTGTYDAERRKYRLEGPTLIHAGKKPGMNPDDIIAWLREHGDETAAQAIEFAWSDPQPDAPADPISDLAVVILASMVEYGEMWPFDRIIGYVEGWEPVRESPTQWANKPINPHRFPVGKNLPSHRGALGLLQAPEEKVSFLRSLGLLP